MMEVEERLLSAIEKLARDGSPGEIRLLAAFLACRGKVEMLRTGWQQPFRDFVERTGASFETDLQGLVTRGIIVRGRGALWLNSDIIRHNKVFVTTRCANRLFALAHGKFALVLKEIAYEDLRPLARNPSVTAENRAIRNMGKSYARLKNVGLLVSSSRTKPHLFPSLHWVEDVPWAVAVAITLRQGNALTWNNCMNSGGMAFHMAVATGCLETDAEGGVRLTARGESVGQAYIEKVLQKRLRWPGGYPDEAVHLVLDELSAPLPAFWIDASSSRVYKTWLLDPGAPLRLLFRDRHLRALLRRMVRRLQKLGLADLITCRDGTDRYYFAPGVAQLAKQAFDLPVERFTLPQEFQAQFAAGFELLAKLSREHDGLWRLRPDPAKVESALPKLKWQRRVVGPDSDGSYRVSDPDTYRETVVELLMDPVAEFLTTLPEELPESSAETAAGSGL